MKIGYARVSRDEQSFERQITALRESGCEVIYSEKMGGGIQHRPELDKMLATLQPGDTVVIQKLDRLGRSLAHLINLIELFKKKGVAFVSLTDYIDTNTAVGELIFHVLGAVAQFEKALIKERVKDGLKQARINGKQLGRPSKDYSSELEQFRQCEGSKEEVMSSMGITEFKYYKLKRLAN